MQHPTSAHQDDHVCRSDRAKTCGRILFAAVAEQAFRYHKRLWKPGTFKVNRSYLRNQILPWFSERPIGAIEHEEVVRWFASLHATPAAANRSLPVLSLIMRRAEACGCRPANSNPCVGIRRYRCPGRERFLSADEFRRLGLALAALDGTDPRTAAVVRLLLLTGCRQGEIRNLEWRDYRERRLFLRDGKTGPRTVWLSEPACRVLDAVPRTGPWLFLAPTGAGPMRSDTLHRRWLKLCKSADLRDVRLHDLRHTYASVALAQGEAIPTIGRLLGHRDPSTTLRYTHFADSSVHDAAQAVGAVLGV